MSSSVSSFRESSSPRKLSSPRKSSSSPRKAKKPPPILLNPVEDEPGEDDGEALQAALAASQLATHSSTSCGNNEVLYNDGATPLFTAIEETKWAEALDLLDVVPEQAATWVKSTGTENTTFGWSLWRRLPIHEACRRQAPAWLVAGLLKAYPDSVRQTTQFGELPIHLAVEMGTAPEVVNLLLVNYYEGIHVEDNGGRTAMTINTDADVLNIDDHTYVQESLKNAHSHLRQIDAGWQNKLAAQAQEHARNVESIHEVHTEAIAQEEDTQKDLQKQLARMEGHLMQYKEERQALERTLSSHHTEKGEWHNTLDSRLGDLQSLTERIELKDTTIGELTTELNAKTLYSHELEERVDVLEQDLINITLLQRDAIQKSLEMAEEDIQNMLASNAVLQGQLQGQTQGLQLLLRERSIALPAAEPEEEEVDEDPDGTMDEHAAMEAAQAVRAAINQSEYEVYEKAVYDKVTTSFSEQEQSMEEEEEKKEQEGSGDWRIRSVALD